MISVSPSCLSVENLFVSFALGKNELDVVKGVSFNAELGKTLCLVGESGSGKSVTTQAILNLLPISGRIKSGSIRFYPNQTGTMRQEPLEISTLSPDSPAMRALRGGQIGMIFQEPMSSLSPVHTIGDQISENWYTHFPQQRAEALQHTLEMLDKVGFPDPKRALSMYPFELSGGMRQRAMIAMALICKPALLIADEPTTALDVTVQAQVLKLLKDLQADMGMTMLVITHDLGVVANIADDVVVMYRGEVMEAGPCHALIDNPKHPYLKGLLDAMPHLDTNVAERLKPLREIKRKKKQNAALNKVSNDVLLSVGNLEKTFSIRKNSWFSRRQKNRVHALSNVSFDIYHGECLGLVGESGCGKTTVSKIVTRLMEPDTGQLQWFEGGESVDLLALKKDALKRFRPNIQMVFQDPVSSLSPRMTVGRIIGEPLEIQTGLDNFERLAKIRAVLEDVGLPTDITHRYPHSFSGGQRQRISIARAITIEPKLLICDEPVSALDVSVQAQVINLLKDLIAETGMSCLFISHNMAVVRYMADRIAVMAAGRIVEMATTRQIFDAPRHPYTKSLLSAVPQLHTDQKLNLDTLLLTGASNPASWPDAFQLSPTNNPVFIEVDNGHHVLVRDASEGSRLCA